VAVTVCTKNRFGFSTHCRFSR